MPIYSQLRVSCGLSATINSAQPEMLKINASETFANWLDKQWLRLSNNNDPDNPLTELCTAREYQWVAVLDYILLRKIRSSFLLCEGINPGALTTEVEEDHLKWNVLTPAFIKILTRLNNSEEDWILWHYNGSLTNLEENMEKPEFRKDALKVVQPIKIFYEIYNSNLSVGPEADWKAAIDNLQNFPQEVSPMAVYTHLDYYKTDFELGGLLQTLGYELDRTNGYANPKNVVPNSIILINRPEHWVCEMWEQRGTVLDSLTMGTDSVYGNDSFNYFKPVDNLKLFKKVLPKLELIFPQIEIYYDSGVVPELPELALPVVDSPTKESRKYYSSYQEKWHSGLELEALTDFRIAVELVGQTDEKTKYADYLMEFVTKLKETERVQSFEEYYQKLLQVDSENLIDEENRDLYHGKIEYFRAQQLMEEGKTDDALEICTNMFDIFQEKGMNEECYEIQNKLGVLFSRAKKKDEALESFKKSLDYALKELEKEQPDAEDGKPRRYWPAIVTALQKKIKALETVTLVE
jgi:tetratricopeptide (TPR) repeat protein